MPASQQYQQIFCYVSHGKLISARFCASEERNFAYIWLVCRSWMMFSGRTTKSSGRRRRSLCRPSLKRCSRPSQCRRMDCLGKAKAQIQWYGFTPLNLLGPCFVCHSPPTKQGAFTITVAQRGLNSSFQTSCGTCIVLIGVLQHLGLILLLDSNELHASMLPHGCATRL